MTEHQPREFAGIDEFIKRCSTDPNVRATSKASDSDWSSFIGLCMVGLFFDEEYDGHITSYWRMNDNSLIPL